MTGFTQSYWMATGFLAVAAIAGFMVPAARAALRSQPSDELVTEGAAV